MKKKLCEGKNVCMTLITSKIQYCLVKCVLFKWSIDETNKNPPTTFNKFKSTMYSFIDNLSQVINYLDSQQTIGILIHSKKYQLKIIYSFCI